jgi:uncharacterized protein (TIGR02452 family)
MKQFIKLYDENHVFNKFTDRTTPTEISVVDSGTFEAAQQYVLTSKTSCLNFANAEHIGGGWEAVVNGPEIITQEEDLFRRSNLPELMFHNPDVQQFYPLTGVKGVFCNKVYVYKDSKLRPCTTYETSVITVPALVHPKTATEYQQSYSKVERIISIAAENRIEILILGAWGCGVFRNDPKIISMQFKSVLSLPKFQNSFKEVVFAIPNERSTNYQIFEYILHAQKSVFIKK